MMDDLEFVKDLLKRARADVAYLEAQLEKSRKEWTKELDAAEEGWRLANRQLEAVRNEHIKIQVKADGVWINFKGNKGRESAVNLNNIVNEMNPSGMTQNICAEAIKAAIGKEMK